jgi:Protein of unknown function (DUF3152)
LAVVTISASAIAVAIGIPAQSGSAGKRNGPKLPGLITYAVSTDPATGVTREEVESLAAVVLADPRSWTPIKKVRFTRTDWSKARLRIRVLTPKATDRFCAPFRTQSYKSCSKNWNVAFNADRWNVGSEYSGMPIDQYRIYLINHEIGHSLGEVHEECPGAGNVAPVMLQQTIGLQGCTPNPWPNPTAPITASTTVLPTPIEAPATLTTTTTPAPQ